MQTFPPTIILRHRKENLKKCSLRGLEQREDFKFYTYPQDSLPPLDGYILLTMEAPPLTEADAHCGLFLIDATWRYADQMLKKVTPNLANIRWRSLPPHYRTAYPRRQEDCPDPECGLASVEALFLSYHLFLRNTEGLMDHYHWKEEFLKKNAIRLLS